MIYTATNSYGKTGGIIIPHRDGKFGNLRSGLGNLPIMHLSAVRSLTGLSLEVDRAFDLRSLGPEPFPTLEDLGMAGPAEAYRAFIEVIATHQMSALHIQRSDDSNIRELFPIVGRKWSHSIINSLLDQTALDSRCMTGSYVPSIHAAT